MLQQVFRVFKKNHDQQYIQIVPIGPHKGTFAENSLGQEETYGLRKIFLDKMKSVTF